MSKPQGCTHTEHTLLPIISPSPQKSLKTNESIISYSLEQERRVSCGVVIQVNGRTHGNGRTRGCLIRAEPRRRLASTACYRRSVGPCPERPEEEASLDHRSQ